MSIDKSDGTSLHRTSINAADYVSFSSAHRPSMETSNGIWDEFFSFPVSVVYTDPNGIGLRGINIKFTLSSAFY